MDVIAGGAVIRPAAQLGQTGRLNLLFRTSAAVRCPHGASNLPSVKFSMSAASGIQLIARWRACTRSALFICSALRRGGARVLWRVVLVMLSVNEDCAIGDVEVMPGGNGRVWEGSALVGVGVDGRILCDRNSDDGLLCVYWR